MSDFVPVARGSAIVTGSSRGIGRAIALRLGAAGVSVAVNYVRSRDEAEQVTSEIRQLGVAASSFQADMADPEQSAGLVSRVERELGPVAVLINNAGITRDRLLIQMTEEDWAATWCTDLAGPRALARAALEVMAPRSYGRIINLSSVVGVTGNAGQANYAASKSAILGLTREMSVSAASSGVTVNCVIPGYIPTDATSHLNDDQRTAWFKKIPMRQPGTVDDIAGAVMFLAGPRASYITGQCLAVDGGLLAAAGGWMAS